MSTERDSRYGVERKLTLDDEIQAFRDGKFQLEFEEVHFRPAAASTKPAYVGPGFAKQEFDGTIRVECRPTNLPSKEHFIGKTFAIRRDPAGTIYTNEDVYEVYARDREGRVWTANCLLLPEDGFPPFMRQVVSCATRFLRHGKGTAPCAKNIRLEFFNENRDDWRWLYEGPQRISIKTLSSEFSLSVGPKGESSVIVEVNSNNIFPQTLEYRLTEALRFVLDLPLDVAILDRVAEATRDIEISQPRTHFVQSYPKITFRLGTDYRQCFSQMLSGYLNYIYDHDYLNDTDWHPCSDFVSLARQSSGHSLESWALGVSVAAEGVASLLPQERKQMEEDLVTARTEILEFVRRSDYRASTKDRIGKLLSQMDNPRAKDAMFGLVNKGHVLKSDIDSWDSIRNRFVHLKGQDQARITSERAATTYKQILSVHRLISAMVFHLIGYKGRYTDYTELGFPNSMFPFSIG